MSSHSLYEKSTSHSPLGKSVRMNAVGAPSGTSMSPQLLELLRDLPDQLGLPKVGLSTPWAGRISDLDWQEINKPDTNVQTFSLLDTDLLRAQQTLFGQPLPFVVIKTLKPVPRSTIETALIGSPYEFFETQAVYRQDDPNPIPRIEFLHWVRRRPLDEEGGKPMVKVADQVGGDLQYGQQVPVENTTFREPPAVPFQQAFDAQFIFGPPVPPPSVSPVPGLLPFPEVPGLPDFPSPGLPEPQDPEREEPVPTPSSPAKMPFWGPVLVAGAVAAATVVIARGARKR